MAEPETAAPVLAATAWGDNSRLMLACRQLGYLHDDDHVLDPTYENGTWWKHWRPEKLTTHNRDLDGSDFRCLPYPDGTFDAIAYDPPYCAKGGRTTSGIEEMDHRYGQEDAPKTPALLQDLINDGLTEMHRLVKPKGIVLAKCMSYVSSGKLWRGTYLTEQHAVSLGFTVEDELLHIKKSHGPQPKERTRKGPIDPETGLPTRIPSKQAHAGRNVTTLLVLRRGR